MNQLSLKKMTGLGAPMSSIVQLILCLGFMAILKRRESSK